jgi:hypothetical protein
MPGGAPDLRTVTTRSPSTEARGRRHLTMTAPVNLPHRTRWQMRYRVAFGHLLPNNRRARADSGTRAHVGHDLIRDRPCPTARLRGRNRFP